MRIVFVAILFCAPYFASAAVFINEIAWMGTTISSSDEWIELSNSGSEQVSLDGWILSIEGKKDIALTGNISANGYYLIERTDDSTVPTVTADIISPFGSGINNTGAVLLLKNASGVEIDRVDGSQSWLIGGNQAGDNTTKDTAQRGPSAWFTGAPTPRATNGNASTLDGSDSIDENASLSDGATTSFLATFPVDPQIFTDAGPTEMTVSTGATVNFTGRAWGLKKEPLENARMVWSFGDGGIADGISVSHVFYYPGEYTVVLDAASGFYAASDRIHVTSITPLIVLNAGGNNNRSYITLENKGKEELNLSFWQIEAVGKKFVIPKNTFVGASKTLTFASEVTGIFSPSGTEIFLYFPNGTRVEVGNVDTTLSHSQNLNNSFKEPAPVNLSATTKVANTSNQEATVLNAVKKDDIPYSQKKEDGWLWYTAVAFLGAFALIGFRFIQSREEKTLFTADDFEIIEETDDFDENEPH